MSRGRRRDRVPIMTIPLWHPEAQQRSADGRLISCVGPVPKVGQRERGVWQQSVEQAGGTSPCSGCHSFTLQLTRAAHQPDLRSVPENLGRDLTDARFSFSKCTQNNLPDLDEDG
jgi:hypothetical protein